MSNRQIWLIADNHFSNKNIIRYCNRPFKTVEEMNKTMIENWNKVVGETDRVFVLGDFALSGKDNIIEIGKQLNGIKTLVLGNHDGASLDTYYAAGFLMVSTYPIIFDEFYILSHEPQYVQEGGVYANIHGHVHNNPMYKTVSSRSFCVSVERINYTPINFEDIKLQIKRTALLEEGE